jgi:poly(A) polymerase
VERAEVPFVKSALLDTDRRVGEGKSVVPSFLLACVLWADVRDGWATRLKSQHSHPALLDAIDDVFNARIGDVSGRGKLAGDMRDIWTMQPRFEKRVGSAPFGLVEQPRFRAAFDFMRLRAENGELDEVLSDWWEEFSLANDNLRNDMVDAVRMEQQQRPKIARAPRVHKAPLRGEVAQSESDMHPDANITGVTVEGDGDGLGAPKKRRRRRRGPGRGANADSSGQGDAPLSDSQS